MLGVRISTLATLHGYKSNSMPRCTTWYATADACSSLQLAQLESQKTLPIPAAAAVLHLAGQVVAQDDRKVAA
jgi:hypothetical protein